MYSVCIRRMQSACLPREPRVETSNSISKTHQGQEEVGEMAISESEVLFGTHSGQTHQRKESTLTDPTI